MSSHRSLIKAITAVFSMTALSSLTGFIRDVYLASLFGVSAGFDAWLVASRIPNLMRDLFSEGCFSQVFVPDLATFKATRTHKETLALIGNLFGVLSLLVLIITLLCQLLAPLIVLILATGFIHDPSRYHIAIEMLWITLPYIMLITLAAYCASVLNTYGSFGVAAFTPALLNIGIMAICYLFHAHFSIPEESLAWGMLGAGLLQLALLLMFLYRKQLLPPLRFSFGNPVVRRILKKLLPALFGASAMKLGMVMTTVFASFLGVGSISWLYYADRLAFLPLGILGVALATAVLPRLSALHANGSSAGFNAALDWILRLLLVTGVPATIGLMCLAGPITLTLFKHGSFTLIDTLKTKQCLIALSIGLPGFLGTKILAGAFYAKHNIAIPTRVALMTLLLTLLLCFCLFSYAEMGLGLAISISALMNALVLFLLLLKHNLFKPIPGWTSFLVQLSLANGIMALLLLRFVPDLSTWLRWNLSYQIFMLVFCIGAVMVVYFTSLWLFGLRWHHINVPSNIDVMNLE